MVHQEGQMRTRYLLLPALVALAALYVLGGSWLSAQQRAASSEIRMAAVPGERGGQDIFGAYDVVADWPKDISTLPGHQAWTYGAGQSVFAESPDRVIALMRGELPNIPRPQGRKLTDLGPSIEFPIGRLPWRDATSASLPGNGGTGALAEDGIAAWEKRGNKLGVDARWEHCIVVFNSKGEIVETWTQWDSMLQRPHFVAISPYDPQKHVWIVDDHKHVVHKFTNDGKTKVLTIGTYGVPGNDATHFNRPTFMDWSPTATTARASPSSTGTASSSRPGDSAAATRTTPVPPISTTCTASPSIPRPAASSSTTAATSACRCSTRTVSSSTSGRWAGILPISTCSTSWPTATCGPPIAAPAAS
jgi:hypothetical protein